MPNREIVRFFKDGIYEFKSYILPDVFDQLLIARDYDDLQIVCAGAFSDGKAVGAAVAQLLENNDVFLQSIIVDPEYQRQHIGTDLLKGILADAFSEFSAANDIEALPTNLFLHADYVLEKDEIQGFDAFLSSFGFNDFYEMEDCCYIEGSKLNMPKDFVQPAGIISFACDSAEKGDSIATYLLSLQLDVNPEYAFLLKDSEDSKAIIVAENGMDGEFFVSSFSKSDISDQEFEGLFYSLVKAVKVDHPDFIFVADEHDITNPVALETLSGDALEIFIHKEAGYYCIFEHTNE